MKFNELNEKQQAKVLDMYRYAETGSSDWYSEIKSDFHEELEAAGFNNVDSQFSGFCVQGDGASFTSEDINVKEVLTHLGKYQYYAQNHGSYVIDNMTAEIVRNDSHYVHEYTMSINIVEGDDVSEVKKEILEYARNKCREYYKKLNEESDRLESDESVKEYIEANDIEFDVKKENVTYI
ncbi:hypothetical protein XaC1_41 [Xanthomonas phage XaC1]|nr:hypothetical protein XaC1_41 [Xanthomonas phage XaC1]